MSTPADVCGLCVYQTTYNTCRLDSPQLVFPIPKDFIGCRVYSIEVDDPGNEGIADEIFSGGATGMAIMAMAIALLYEL